jgi:hypothetical protein
LREPILPLSFVRDAARHAPIACGLVNGFSYGGTFAALVFRSLEGAADSPAEKDAGRSTGHGNQPTERNA